MKDNRKNRKIKFIRVKNKLRKGQVKFYSTGKQSCLHELNEELVIDGKGFFVKGIQSIFAESYDFVKI